MTVKLFAAMACLAAVSLGAADRPLMDSNRWRMPKNGGAWVENEKAIQLTVPENVVPEIHRSGKALQKRDPPPRSHLKKIEPRRMRADVDHTGLVGITVLSAHQRNSFSVRTSASRRDSD